ncbi:Mini-ribonuclease 3 [Heliorestis acidaminivorans]|uniref:Mini-ribonuclease 3 n=1 Tax=Heliorestis acidaminivorans TaxID=553427 RepID=A0A6I0EZR8_9FIRM|nr:ribonuclease III domain-containing protein [Heliorestis acidaminivorans]KAB2951434.1 Mini-ribonuclease 3 [Heliorestis acidaminivorans]
MMEKNSHREKALTEMPAPLALAYLGDAVYELHVRRFLIQAGLVKVHRLHRLAVELVKASAQVQILRWLEDKLEEDELEWVRRGRNADSGKCPKSTDVVTYRLATGFECLIGYWSLCRAERMELLEPYLQNWLAEKKGK